MTLEQSQGEQLLQTNQGFIRLEEEELKENAYKNTYKNK